MDEDRYKKLDKELDMELEQLFNFDKYDEIVLSKNDFKIKMAAVKQLILINQMRGFFESLTEFSKKLKNEK